MLGVGIVGVSSERGWALRAHLPALRALPDVGLAAVGTSREESARWAAGEFGVPAFTDPAELAAHPAVELVVITVRVPRHAELVRAALAAGKHVFCEWPLGRDTAEAAELAAAADAEGVRTVTGLQTRFAPAVSYARELLAAGHVGTVTGATLLTSRAKGGDGRVPGWAAYTFDSANGAGSLEVMGGHALDAVGYLLGELTGIRATLAVRRPMLTVAETGAPLPVDSPDTIAVQAELPGGAVFSGQLRDGESAPPRTRLEIAGTAGNLAIVSLGGDRWEDVQFSVGDLAVRSTVATGNWRDLHIPVRHRVSHEFAEPGARNISRLYRQFAEDLRTGERHTPDFTDAVRLHRVLDDVRGAGRD